MKKFSLALLGVALLAACSGTPAPVETVTVEAPAPVVTETTEAPAPVVTTPPPPPEPVATTEPALDVSEFSTRDIQVMSLTIVLEQSSDRQLMCDGYDMMGVALTTTAINVEVPADEQFPEDVIREVFDAVC